MGKIYIIADIHGDYRPIKQFFNKISPEDVDTLVLLGDAGLQFFFNHRDRKTKEKINKYQTNIFIIRGNHEQRPSICMIQDRNNWHTEMYWNNLVFVENDYPYIKYALDHPAKYEIPTAAGDTIQTLVLPGAYSVDKYHRLANNWSWFEDEQPKEWERTLGLSLIKSQSWDLILSHTCPICYEPTDLFLPVVDQSTVDKTTERWLGEVEYLANYKLWCFGHFHANRVYPHFNNSDRLMLFNDCCCDLYKYFCGNYKIENCLISLNNQTKITNLNIVFNKNL